jgi:NifU-like protein involved in Fe-S cluster formation
MPMAIELLNGKTVGEAVQTTKTALITAAKKWKSVKWLSIPMMWNHEYMQVLGDMNSRLWS